MAWWPWWPLPRSVQALSYHLSHSLTSSPPLPPPSLSSLIMAALATTRGRPSTPGADWPCCHSPLGEEQTTILSVLPIYHIYGLAVNTLLGAKAVIMPKSEPGTFLASLAQHQPTHLNMVP